MMKTTMMILGAVLVAGCAGNVSTAERGPCDPPSDCFTEGDSQTWGPGPNTYCPEADGSEWHLYNGLATHYVVEPGTKHTPSKVICEVPHTI